MLENHVCSAPSRRVLALAGIAAALTLVAACEGGKPADNAAAPAAPAASTAAAKPADNSPALATYNGKSFTLADYQDATGRLNARARKSLDESVDRRKQFVENDILSDLIYAEGEKRGLDKDPEIRKRLDELQRHLVVQQVMEDQQSASVTDEDVKAYYDAHTQEFSTERVKASHILVDNEQLAKEIYDKVKADPSQFSALAAENSKDLSNAKRGGELGFFGRGRMVKEFEEVAFGLKADGDISPPVQTRFGWHIIMRTGREEGKMQEFDQVKNQIKVKLVSEMRRDKTTKFLEDLKTKAALKINDAELANAKAPAGGDDKDEGGGEGMPAGH